MVAASKRIMGQRGKPIVLLGMPGAGKSSAGKALASALSLPFRDSDAAVEKAFGKTVSAIFANEGEAAFRKAEEEVMASLLSGGTAVIAAGGGAVLSARTRRLLREKAVTVWLTGEEQGLLDRALHAGNRPLLQGAEPKRAYRHLLQMREPFYREADVHVDTTALTACEVCEAILDALTGLP